MGLSNGQAKGPRIYREIGRDSNNMREKEGDVEEKNKGRKRNGRIGRERTKYGTL